MSHYNHQNQAPAVYPPPPHLIPSAACRRIPRVSASVVSATTTNSSRIQY
ncbi:hypothetical protein TB1_004500 [Malus domestica]